MNDEKNTQSATSVVDAIVSLKEKAKEANPLDGKVDLVAIVKKLARNRERSKRAARK